MIFFTLKDNVGEVKIIKIKTLSIGVIIIGLIIGALGYFLFVKVFIPNMM